MKYGSVLYININADQFTPIYYIVKTFRFCNRLFCLFCTFCYVSKRFANERNLSIKQRIKWLKQIKKILRIWTYISSENIGNQNNTKYHLKLLNINKIPNGIKTHFGRNLMSREQMNILFNVWHIISLQILESVNFYH